jgi:hypothetical protein
MEDVAHSGIVQIQHKHVSFFDNLNIASVHSLCYTVMNMEGNGHGLFKNEVFMISELTRSV